MSPTLRITLAVVVEPESDEPGRLIRTQYEVREHERQYIAAIGEARRINLLLVPDVPVVDVFPHAQPDFDEIRVLVMHSDELALLLANLSDRASDGSGRRVAFECGTQSIYRSSGRLTRVLSRDRLRSGSGSGGREGAGYA